MSRVTDLQRSRPGRSPFFPVWAMFERPESKWVFEPKMAYCIGPQVIRNIEKMLSLGTRAAACLQGISHGNTRLAGGIRNCSKSRGPNPVG